MSHGPEEDLAWTSEWQELFTASDRVDRAIMRLVGGDWAAYVQAKLAFIDAERRLGLEYGTTYHPGRGWTYDDNIGVHELRELVAQYIREGGRFSEADRRLGVPWPVIARALSNGRPTMLVTWTEDTCDDFELDARDGLGIRELERRYGLPYKLTRSLAAMFRGP